MWHTVHGTCSTVADVDKAPNGPNRWSGGLDLSKMKLHTWLVVSRLLNHPVVYPLDRFKQRFALNEQAEPEKFEDQLCKPKGKSTYRNFKFWR